MDAAPAHQHGDNDRMASRQPMRSLAALATSASTSRVLNLGFIARRAESDPDHQAKPMFDSPALNGCIVIKHRLRSNESHLFPPSRHVVTKLVFPFDWKDLAIGGRSILVEQKGFAEALLTDIGMRAQLTTGDHEMLGLLDRLPSLDPFLLREHLRRHGRQVADCYFDITPSDSSRMQNFVGEELSSLMKLAFDSGDPNFADHATRMVDAILSSEISDRLAPLQATLGMGTGEFREGVFCWKGFLYYKWSLQRIESQIVQLVGDFRRLRMVGSTAPETRAYLETIRGELAEAIADERRKVRASLKVYDDAYNELVQKGHAAAFREFLLSAPGMFLDIGDRLGIVSHMSSFWRYRFPSGTPLEMAVEEGLDLFREFESSLARNRKTEIAWA
jgi:hypothetical protein